MKKNHTKLIFYISIVSMLIAIAVLIIFFKIVENKNKHISAVTTTLKKKISDKEHGEAIASKLAEVDTIYSNVKSHFVDSTQIDSFVEYLEKIALDLGTSVKVENFEIPEAEKNTMLVRVSFAGDFTNVMKTIKLLENTPYQTRITNFSILKNLNTDEKDPKNAGGVFKWEATLTVSI